MASASRHLRPSRDLDENPRPPTSLAVLETEHKEFYVPLPYDPEWMDKWEEVEQKKRPHGLKPPILVMPKLFGAKSKRERIDPADQERLDANYNMLIDKYGAEFVTEYGNLNHILEERKAITDASGIESVRSWRQTLIRVDSTVVEDEPKKIRRGPSISSTNCEAQVFRMNKSKAPLRSCPLLAETLGPFVSKFEEYAQSGLGVGGGDASASSTSTSPGMSRSMRNLMARLELDKTIIPPSGHKVPRPPDFILSRQKARRNWWVKEKIDYEDDPNRVVMISREENDEARGILKDDSSEYESIDEADTAESDSANSSDSANNQSDSITTGDSSCNMKQIHPASNGNTSDSQIEKVQIVHNTEEILSIFRAKDLSSMERSRFPDNPFGVNKFYRINTEYHYAEWKLDRSAIMDNLKEFVCMPVAIGFVVNCRVFRDKRGVDRGIFPTYTVSLENPHCKGTILLTARKRKKTATATYLISTDPTELVRAGASTVGKLNGNIIGTHFTVYDGGLSPKKSDVDSKTPREELAFITYEPNVLGIKGPRIMKFILPAMISETRRFECHPDGNHNTISSSCKKRIMHGLMELRNKTPIYNETARSYVLNFQGRVTQASVKNFQIIHPDKEDYIILQFGRMDEDAFSLDIKYPLSPLQAFGIILSSFANKWACE